MGIINFFTEQLEQNVDKPKGREYIIRFISCLTKGLLRQVQLFLITYLTN